MCGIAGFVQKKGSKVEQSTLDEMLSSLVHRGPDGSGSWRETHQDWELFFGHRRLSIIDLSSGGQPLKAPDGRVITFNGEIFNFLELKPKLISKGYHFKTASDTEVLLHHLDANSKDPLIGLSELNAMFAFAYWDPKREELILARDHAGIKPLYYYLTPADGIVFASELSSLKRHPEVPTSVSASGLKSFFFADYIHPGQTIFDGVFKLLPGHYLVWKAGKTSQPKPFWNLNKGVVEMDTPEEILQKKLREHLERAISRQLIADVPVGIFLSGGIDSSIVATLAQKSRPKDPIKTFSIAFEESDYDESGFARQMANLLGTEHIVETMNQDLLVASLDEVLDSLDEPLADPSILPTYALCRLASRYVKVVLGGDGGDELWAGYPTYQAHEWANSYQSIPEGVRTSLIKPIVSSLPLNLKYQSFEWKAKRFVQRWDNNPVRRHLRWMSATDLPLLEKCFPEVSEEPLVLRQQIPEFSDVRNSLLALDFTTYMSGSVLTKVDRASMAHGLEVRPPFLDTDLVSWAFSLPYHWKRTGRNGKLLLKSTFKNILPSSILNRPKKGFGIPLAKWLTGPLKPKVAKAFNTSPLWDSKIVSRDAFGLCYQQFLEKKVDHSKTLWALLVLDHWMKKENIRCG